MTHTHTHIMTATTTRRPRLKTLAEINAAHAAFMVLPHNAPKRETDRVIKLHESTAPRRYLVVDDAIPGKANLYWCGPMWSEPQPLEWALEAARKAGVRTDIAWNTRGEYVAL